MILTQLTDKKRSRKLLSFSIYNRKQEFRVGLYPSEEGYLPLAYPLCRGKNLKARDDNNFPFNHELK